MQRARTHSAAPFTSSTLPRLAALLRVAGRPVGSPLPQMTLIDLRSLSNSSVASFGSLQAPHKLTTNHPTSKIPAHTLEPHILLQTCIPLHQRPHLLAAQLTSKRGPGSPYRKGSALVVTQRTQTSRMFCCLHGMARTCWHRPEISRWRCPQGLRPVLLQPPSALLHQPAPASPQAQEVQPRWGHRLPCTGPPWPLSWRHCTQRTPLQCSAPPHPPCSGTFLAWLAESVLILPFLKQCTAKLFNRGSSEITKKGDTLVFLQAHPCMPNSTSPMCNFHHKDVRRLPDTILSPPSLQRNERSSFGSSNTHGQADREVSTPPSS